MTVCRFSCLNETMVPLRYTPRRFVVHPKKKLLVIVEEREAARKECFEPVESREW